MGVDHRRVENYLPKTKVITEEILMEQAKKDIFEEKNKDEVEEEAKEIKETETIKPGGDAEVDKVCSQIVLERAEDSSDDSDEETQDLVHGEEDQSNDTKVDDEVFERMEDSSDDESDEEDSCDNEDLAVIQIEANLSDELLKERNEAVKKVQSLDDVESEESSTGCKLKSKVRGDMCSSIVDKMRRKRKTRKSRQAGTKKVAKYCLCQRPYERSDGPMVGCDGGCSQWFHFSCLGFSPNHKMPPGRWNCEACRQPKG